MHACSLQQHAKMQYCGGAQGQVPGLPGSCRAWRTASMQFFVGIFNFHLVQLVMLKASYLPASCICQYCSTSLSCLQAQRHQMLQSRVSLQEQQLQLQKQAHQLQQAAQRFPGLAVPNGAGQPTPSSGPSTGTVPAVAPPAAQATQPGPTQS